MTSDQRRTARLLLAPSGDLSAPPADVPDDILRSPELRRVVGGKRVPLRPVRILQRLGMRRGSRGWVEDCVEPVEAARRAALGNGAEGPPRFLFRVDEFPHADVVQQPTRLGSDAYRRFHEVLSQGEIPYLLAIVPRPSVKPYDPTANGDRALAPDERELIASLRSDGVVPAVHGLDHRTTDARPRRHAELIGHSDAALSARLDRAHDLVEEVAGTTRVLVPPFNRFAAGQYRILAERFDVVCGGPESVLQMGLQTTPQVRSGSLYLPSYPPLYGRAHEVAKGVGDLIERNVAVWAPIVLHWGWEEEEDYVGLERLVELSKPFAAPWSELLTALDSTRPGKGLEL